MKYSLIELGAENKMAKPGHMTTRQAKNTQAANDFPDLPIPVTDILHHEGFLDAVKNAVKQAVREEMKTIRAELTVAKPFSVMAEKL